MYYVLCTLLCKTFPNAQIKPPTRISFFINKIFSKNENDNRNTDGNTQRTSLND
jgi:hypothetical protein